MLDKVSFSIFTFVLSSYASCLLDDKLYNSISWKKESFPFEIIENHLIAKGVKFILQDYNTLLKKGIISYSVDERYAKITQSIQCEGCFPTLGYSFFEIKSDTLKRCDYISNVDLNAIKKKLKK
jgi:hypothetical protein